ncbi:MAG: hypothetical protein NVS9B7_23120 [Flavisolibacter sp.]
MRKIVIIGPESTGKSTLCQQLAAHYKTTWCPEYAREYLNKIKIKYTYQDLLQIAMGQLALEEEMKAHSSNQLYFIDTDMNVIKVWCEVVFGNCHKWILKQIAQTHYDLYLLCNTDIEWVQDDLREYPDLQFRKKLFSIYKDIMINIGTPWVEISGRGNIRLAQAIQNVDNLLNGK